MESQFVGFQLAEQSYAFRIDRIREIVMPTAAAGLPDVPAYVDGVCNLRGTIIPLINLRVLFGLPRRPIDAETRTVVVSVGPRIIGCLVDSVSRVMRLPMEQIKPVPDTISSGARNFLDGFAHVGDQICILLNVDALLDPAQLDTVHRAGVGRLIDPLAAPARWHARTPRTPTAPARQLSTSRPVPSR